MKPLTRVLAAVCLLTTLAAAPPVPDPGDALREAALKGDLAQVKKLLDSGVPVDAPEPRHGQTPLLMAAFKGQTDVVKLLVERGANVNAREDFFGATPLTSALQGGY